MGWYSLVHSPSLVNKSDNVKSTLWIILNMFVAFIANYCRLSNGAQDRFLSWEGKMQNRRIVLCHQLLPFLIVVKKSRYLLMKFTLVIKCWAFLSLSRLGIVGGKVLQARMPNYLNQLFILCTEKKIVPWSVDGKILEVWCKVCKTWSGWKPMFIFEVS